MRLCIPSSQAAPCSHDDHLQMVRSQLTRLHKLHSHLVLSGLQSQLKPSTEPQGNVNAFRLPLFTRGWTVDYDN